MEITTFAPLSNLFDLARCTVKTEENGSPVSVSLNDPNSPSACPARFARSTKNKTLFAGVCESILYAAAHAVKVFPAPVAISISALVLPDLKLSSNFWTASNWQSRKPFLSRRGSPPKYDFPSAPARRRASKGVCIPPISRKSPPFARFLKRSFSPSQRYTRGWTFHHDAQYSGRLCA